MKTKEETKNYFYSVVKDFLKAIPAGFFIALAGLAYLSCESKVVGALFFTVGLFAILVFNLNLFTGKVCYAFTVKPKYALNLFAIWCGNFVGAAGTGLFLRLTRLSSLIEKCTSVANTKLNDGLLSVFILAMLCNVLIFVAVHGFNNFKFDLARALALFFGVSIFVLCGFEHCVANMFYFTFAGVWSAKTFGYLLIMTLGNMVGGIVAYYALVAWQKIALTKQKLSDGENSNNLKLCKDKTASKPDDCSTKDTKQPDANLAQDIQEDNQTKQSKI